MAATARIARKWRAQQPPLPAGARPSPDPYAILLSEVMWTYWDVLVFERLGKPVETRVAREDCRIAVDNLRNSFDKHPEVGPEAANAMIAWQLHHAREAFAADMARGKWRRYPGELRRYG